MFFFYMVMNDLFFIICVLEFDDCNVVVVFKVDVDWWIGIDESVGEGISREIVGCFFRFFVEINFLLWLIG